MGKFALLFLFLLVEVATAGETDSAAVLDLTVQHAFELALKQNPGLQQMRAQVEAKSATFWSSFGLPSPVVSYMSEGNPLEGSSSSVFLEKRWTVSQSLDFPLRSYYRLSRVSTEREALERKLESQTRKLKAGVKKTYTDVLYSLQLLLLREEALELARSLQDAVTARYEVGEGSELERMEAEIRVAEAENGLTDAERVLHKARYSLFNMIGLDPEEQAYGIRFPDSLIYLETDFSQDTLLASLDYQPEAVSVRRAVDAADHGVSEAWSRLLPDFNLSYYRQDFGTGFDFYGYEIGFTVPLWFMFDQRGEIEQSQALRMRASWEERETLQALKKEVEVAWHGYDASLQAIQRHEKLIRVLSTELKDLSLEAYRLGEIDLLGLLYAQQRYLDSRIAYLDALRNYYHHLVDIERFLRADLVLQTTTIE
jgi:cobalt-zinc-cadmium efflux system outer membrane protein